MSKVFTSMKGDMPYLFANLNFIPSHMRKFTSESVDLTLTKEHNAYYTFSIFLDNIK